MLVVAVGKTQFTMYDLLYAVSWSEGHVASYSKKVLVVFRLSVKQ